MSPLMARISAFSIHLGISLIIFAFLAYLVLMVWYPGLFFDSDGGWQGMRIIIAVDLVLGPLLTLIVYKQGKPKLKMDLTMVAVFQIACLIAGTWVVYSERPIAMVYVDGRFASMSADSYRDAGMEVPDLSELPGKYPKWVSVSLPTDVEDLAAVRREAQKAGRPLNTFANLYEPFEPLADAVVGASYQLDSLRKRDREGALDPWLDERQSTVDGYRFYPFGTRFSYVFIAIKEDGSDIAMLPVPGPV